MKVDLKNLKESIRRAKIGLASKDVVEELTNITFINGNIITYNDKLCVVCPFSEIKDTFAVKADDFQKILEAFTTEEIEIEISKSKIKLTSKDTISELEINNDPKLIKDVVANIDSKKGFTKVSEDFIASLGLVSFSADKTISEQNLHCVAVRKGNIISTDGLRFSVAKTEDKVKDFLIQATVANKIGSLEIESIKVNDDWVSFKDKEGTVYLCRNIPGEYPDSLEFVEKTKFGKEKYKFPEDTKEKVKAISFMCSGDTPFEKGMEVTMGSKGLILKAKRNRDYIKKKIKASYKKEVSFIINPEALYDILSITDTINISKESDMAKLSSDNFIHIMRVTVK